MIGQTFGHYRVLEEIGRGGMGVVYRARDSRLDRDVAIKVLPTGSVADSFARKRLLREARTASQLNHPNICTIYDAGEADGQLYIAMELVKGRPLREAFASQGFYPETVVRVGVQIADALAHAHKLGVVHRDLKSANILLTPEGRAKILDFGLATCIASELDEATRSQYPLADEGAIAGTLPYMAPEVLRGHPADARTDLWGLGVVLYELATGQLPFQGATGFELTSAILHEQPLPLLGRVPLSLRIVIERCLTKEPSQRYQHAGELRAALEMVTSAPEAAPHSARGAVLPWQTQRRRIAVVVLGFACIVLSIGGLALWIKRPSELKPPFTAPSSNPSSFQPAETTLTPPQGAAHTEVSAGTPKRQTSGVKAPDDSRGMTSARIWTRRDVPDLMRRAEGYAGQGEYEKAILLYTEVLRLDPQNEEAREGLRKARDARYLHR